jgi:hypothetical protein
MTIKGMAGVILEPVTIGLSFAMQNQSKLGAKGADVSPNGLSAFARGAIMEKTLAWFARFDMYNPDSKNDTIGYKENFITAGLDWQPEKDVHVMPNIWVNTWSDKSAAATKRDADIVGRLTFFYKF